MFNAAPSELPAEELVSAPSAESSAANVLLLKPTVQRRAEGRDSGCHSDSAFIRTSQNRAALSSLLRTHGLAFKESIPLVEGSRFVVGPGRQTDLYGPAKLEDLADAMFDTLHRAVDVVRSKDPKGVTLDSEVKRTLAHLATTRQQLIWPKREIRIQAQDLFALQSLGGEAVPHRTLMGTVREIDHRNQRIRLCSNRFIEFIRTDTLKVGDTVKLQCRHSHNESYAVFELTDPDQLPQLQLKLNQ